ncbi:SAV_2336 N-terminal domain-related protein [Streptomyces sp. NRRL S-1022]|uniref:SAV_2336 N-terminal domain-related protein n=1 Tax=Streptomyces sp. NRRL S-1022 TaxID=1463880 RepID=UPI00099BD6A2|nr:SAV_2336 N-terminal domain-related protein [Streptomyces sp. NRRL S-1022]
MIRELERILRAAGVDLDDEDLLDALWLSRRLPRGAGTPLARRVPGVPAAGAMPETAAAPAAGARLPATDALPHAPTGSPPLPEAEGAAPEHLGAVSGAPSPVTASGGLRLPGAKVLGSELSLGRALRPLKRRVPSVFHTELDEQATAASQADTEIPNVVLRARPERWLRLALVIDSEVSMVLWERHCRELQAALEHSGAFRQIEVHQLWYRAAAPASSAKQREVFLVRPWSGSRTTALPATTLNDPSGRTLVLVVTDGAAPAWQDGRMRAQLEKWASSGPTAVVHVLPRHLWAGTGVTADTWHVTAPRPGSANAAWRIADPLLPPDVSSFAGVPVPVVELTPSGLHAWADAITTVGRPVPLRLWEPRTPDTARSAGRPAPRSAARAFLRTASPPAVRLAAHLAAVAPVTVPVMHLVQTCLPGAAGASALAEIFLGGLLRPVPREGQARPEGPAKHRLFDFTEATKDLLLDTVPLRELVASSRRVGERVEQLVGRSPDFPAWLVPPARAGRPDGAPHPFARVGTALLSRLGYDEAEAFVRDDDEEEETTESESPPPLCRALVITSLAGEYSAVRSHLADREELVDPYGTIIERGRLAGTSGFVAIAEVGEGNTTAAVLISRMLDWLRPEAVLLTGVASSLRGDIRIGDVVVGTKTYDFHRGTQTPTGFGVRPEAWTASHALTEAARSAVENVSDVRVHFKPVATGDVLLARETTRLLQHLRDQFDDAGALAVDSWGSAHMTYLNGDLDLLTVRGISDLAHAEKRGPDSPETFVQAAAQAARVTMAVLLHYLADPNAEEDRYDEPHYTASPPTAVDALPPTDPSFTGRDAELARLMDVLAPGSPDVPVIVLSGLAGTGKTTLVLHAAHEARSRGWFPGGTLLVNLRGYADTPVTAHEGLDVLLRALGIDPTRIPGTADEREALYRAVLAERVRQQGPMLIVADDASSSEQVRPLLPGGGHRLLVTSRHRLPQLGARFMQVHQLAPDESVELLQRALTVARASDDRVRADVRAARRLAELCGYLPLALQIAAALLAEDPGRPVADLVGQLAASRDRTDRLDDGERSVRAAFDLSYRSLPPEQARLLSLLALAPGPEASDQVIAALVGSEQSPTGDLRALARAHLVERVRSKGWRVHDLVRAYGNGVVAADVELRGEGAAARDRVLALYGRWAKAADARLRWLPGMPEPQLFASRAEALAWLDREREGLVSAVHWATEERYARAAVDLAGDLAYYLMWRRYFAEWITVSTVALDAARLTGDQATQAIAYGNLGKALQQTGRMEEAVSALNRARDLQHDAGNPYGEATAWSNLGDALQLAGRVDEAIDALSRARDLHQAVGNRVDEGMAWNSLGLALHMAGRMEEAMESLTRARDLYNATGDRHSEGIALHNLGLALHSARRPLAAAEAYSAAVEIFREFEDWYGTGQALESRASLHLDAGERTRARTTLLEAAEAYARAAAHSEAARALAHAEELV